MNVTDNPHDVVAYPAFAYVDTHPSRLATMARLHGLQPAPVERCRVLEIGCNAAANLIPMAYALPHSEFTGFDLAAQPIERGREKIQALGLTNLRILQADLMETDRFPELRGQFDYIIAHGVYSWIPAPVRDRLMRYCGEHLSPAGVAFISYSAQPGGHVRLLARDILHFRQALAEGGVAGLRESLSFLQFIAGSRPEGDGFRVLLERELANMVRRGPEVVFHDEMSTAYQPVLFGQFVQHAAQHGLRYVSEAEFPSPKDPAFQAETARKAEELAGGNPIAREQILDFIRMRMYRESLLCHADAPVSDALQTEALRQLFLCSQAESAAGARPGVRIYTLPGGLQIETEQPTTVAVLEYLIASAPEAVTFAQMVSHLDSQGMPFDSALQVLLLRLVISRMVELRAWQAPVSRSIAEKPFASLVCRQEALTGTQIVTLLHTTLSMTDPIARQLLLLLDGTRDRDALLRDLSGALPEVPAQTLAEGIEPALHLLGRAGVLEERAGA